MKRLVLVLLLLTAVVAHGGEANRGALRAPSVCRTPDQHDGYVLAITWQPGFCERTSYSGRKPECERMADGRLTVDHLTLHGLWPDKKSCGAGYGQCGGRLLDLRPDTLAYVQPWMPNFYDETSFGEYEWQKHGTCQTGMDDDAYFRKAVDAVATVNNAAAGRYIAAHIGGAISKRELYAKVNREVGDNRAANSFLLLCKGNYLYEIRVRLPREFKTGDGLAALLGLDLRGKAATDRNQCRQDRILIEQSGEQ